MQCVLIILSIVVVYEHHLVAFVVCIVKNILQLKCSNYTLIDKL